MCGEQLVISSDIVAVRARQRRLGFHHATVLPPKYQAQRPLVFLAYGARVFVFFLNQKVRNNFAAGSPLYWVGNDDLKAAFLCRWPHKCHTRTPTLAEQKSPNLGSGWCCTDIRPNVSEGKKLLLMFGRCDRPKLRALSLYLLCPV